MDSHSSKSTARRRFILWPALWIFLVAVTSFTTFALSPLERQEQARASVREIESAMTEAKMATVYLLSAPTGADGDKAPRFSIHPGEKGDTIAREAVLKNANLQVLKNAWKELGASEWYDQMACHLPAHGLRFQDASGKVILEMTICFRCNNYDARTPEKRIHGAFPRSASGDTDSTFRRMITGLLRATRPD